MLKSRETGRPMLQHGARGRANDLLKTPVALPLNPVCYSTHTAAV